MATVRQLLNQAESAIRRSKAVDLWRVSDARSQAEELLGEILGEEIDRETLGREVTPSERRRFEGWVARRVEGEPVALILKKTEFKGLELRVRPNVFVPRNSSELLADEAIRRLRSRKSRTAVDVCTGGGPVALAVARALRRSRVWGLDIWSPALGMARRNAKRLRIRNVTFLKSDMLKRLPRSLKGKVDVFTLHPPYIPRRQMKDLPKEIKDYEPEPSLTDQSDDGLHLVRNLAQEAPAWLRPGGWLLVEVSPDLSRSVKSILHQHGFSKVRSLRDSLGATRVICGSLPR
jgi:release factor glutamine methyltransferase